MEDKRFENYASSFDIKILLVQNINFPCFLNDKDVDEYIHWVDIDNDRAISIYRKFGYNFGIKKANEYIWRCSDER